MKKTSLFLMTIIALSIFSCKKKDESTTPLVNNSNSEKLKSFFKDHTAKSQTFTVNIDNDNATVTAAKGTSLHIPKGAFKHTNGSKVIGDITIEIKEIFDKSDMVLSNITTVSNKKILESGGEIFINATADGQQLIINPDTSLVIGVPKDTTNENMQLFIGQGAEDNFNWQEEPKKDTINQVKGNQGGTYNPYDFFMYKDFFCSCYNATQYFTSINKLGWINMDCFYSNNSTINDIPIITPGFDNSNSALFVVFKNKNVVINIYSDIAYHNAGYYKFSLPNEEECTAILIGYKDGKHYLAEQDFTVNNSFSLNLNPIESSEDQITSSINSLN